MAPHRAACLLATTLGAVALGCAGEADDTELEPASAEPEWGYSGPSLCTEERDPSGDWCDPEGKIGSQRAFALAREKVPDLPLTAVISYGDALDPDGRDLSWLFQFDPGDPEQQVGVFVPGYGAGAGEPETAPLASLCSKRAAIEAFDSERLVPDALLRLEDRTGGLFRGQIRMEFGHCAHRPESNIIEFVGDELEGRYYARYWGDGRYIELVGPCSGSTETLDSCLEGRRY